MKGRHRRSRFSPDDSATSATTKLRKTIRVFFPPPFPFRHVGMAAKSGDVEGRQRNGRAFKRWDQTFLLFFSLFLLDGNWLFDVTLCDAGERKIRRYQQYFCVKEARERHPLFFFPSFFFPPRFFSK